MQTGLHGKLEELGLDEILQIVGVSRRTGILTLNSRGREAVLYFRDGLLVRASSTGFQQSLGELLVRSGAVSQDTIQQALLIQQQERFRERIGSILTRRFDVDLQVIERTVREQINNVLLTLFAWTEGSFDCTATDVETVDAAYLDPVQLLLEMGDATAEQLAEAGLRLQAELGIREPEPESDIAELVDVLPENKETSLGPCLIVDDDRILAAAVAEELSPWFETLVFTRSEEALQHIDSLYKSGSVPPLVLVDLIMPKMDGTGVLGGLELIQLLHRNFAAVRMVAISDFRHEAAIQEVTALGCLFVDKPRRGEVEGEQFVAFIGDLKRVLTL